MHGFLLSGQFTTIDYPNATLSRCWGINNNGEIVGEYNDAAGTTHGFLLSGGKFTSITYPRATYTEALGNNLAGQIVGRYRLADGSTHGYLLSNGTYTSIDYPNASSTWWVGGINDNGEITGQWVDKAGINHGFYAVKQ
jgi:probable HAF family extracellular repeat protein